MQYLFNKVYLSLDNAFEIGTTCVLITPLVETFPTNEFELAVTRSDLGPILASGASFEETVENAGGEQAFFEAITNADPSQKVLIYAAPSAYIKFLSKWLKALLPSLDGATAHDLITLTLVRLKHTYGYPYVPHKFLTKDQALQYKHLPLALADKEMFAATWEDLEPFDMSAHGYQYYAERCGIEFLLATFFSDPQTPYRDLLEHRVTMLTRMTMIDLITDQFNRVARQPSVIPNYDVHLQTLDEWAEDHPQYAALVDPRLSSSELDYVLETYDLSQLGQLYLEVLGWLGLALKPDHHVVELWTETVDVLDAVLQVELATPQYSPVIAAGTRSNIINTYVLNRLLNEKREGKTTLAEKLSLAS